MTLHQLEIILSVAQHLSYSATARQYHISQPAISKHIRLLEEECGGKIFEKNGKGVKITETGRKVADFAREILSRVNNLKNDLGVYSPSGNGGSLRIGSHHGMSVSLVPSVLSAFKKTHQQVQLFYHTDLSPSLESMVEKSEIELALITNPSYSKSLVYEVFQQNQAVFVVSKNHPLAKKTQLTIEEFCREPFVVLKLKKGVSTQERLIKEMRIRGKEMNSVIFCESIYDMISSVKAGIGTGIIHKESIKYEIMQGELKVLKVAGIKTKIATFIIYHKEFPLSSITKDFLSFLRKLSHKSTPAEALLGSSPPPAVLIQIAGAQSQ